jgi:ribosomal protein S18 acetylase RimI-like enzyme
VERRPSVAVRFVHRHPFPTDRYRRLYKEVGEQWFWHDRLEWSDEALERHLASPNVVVWELETESGESVGYVELHRHDDASVEIAYFGLVPKFMGRGLGGLLLTHAVRESWSMGAERVWLHTCTLDSDRALPNYKARGFREYKTQRLEVEIDGTRVVSERLLDD